MRRRRFARFERLAAELPRPLKVLDIGGTNRFWEQCGWAEASDVWITLVNRRPQDRVYSNIDPHVGDATDLRQFGDSSFDLVFSNSVIEHLFTFDNQRIMANEVRRLAKCYWIQTPNFWFPYEPHFRTLGWQWLPLSIRVTLIQRRSFGFRGKAVDRDAAWRKVAEIRLMKRRELQEIFPDARIE